MKKINIETKYNVMKEMAKELGIKFVGVKKEDLVEAINAKIEEIEPAKTENKKAPKGKWFDQEGAFPYQAGDLSIIVNHKNKAIVGRMFEIVGPSTKKNAFKGYLINPKSGARQGTCLSLDFDMVETFIPSYPMVIAQ